MRISILMKFHPAYSPKNVSYPESSFYHLHFKRIAALRKVREEIVHVVLVIITNWEGYVYTWQIRIQIGICIGGLTIVGRTHCLSFGLYIYIYIYIYIYTYIYISIFYIYVYINYIIYIYKLLYNII